MQLRRRAPTRRSAPLGRHATRIPCDLDGIARASPPRRSPDGDPTAGTVTPHAARAPRPDRRTSGRGRAPPRRRSARLAAEPPPARRAPGARRRPALGQDEAHPARGRSWSLTLGLALVIAMAVGIDALTSPSAPAADGPPAAGAVGHDRTEAASVTFDSTGGWLADDHDRDGQALQRHHRRGAGSPPAPGGKADLGGVGLRPHLGGRHRREPGVGDRPEDLDRGRVADPGGRGAGRPWRPGTAGSGWRASWPDR